MNFRTPMTCFFFLICLKAVYPQTWEHDSLRMNLPPAFDSFEPQTDDGNEDILKINLLSHWAYGPCYVIHAKDGIAYVGNGSLLQILDISNPVNPQKIAEYLLPTYLYNFVVSEPYIYTLSDRLRIIDVSEKTDPKEIGDMIWQSQGYYYNARPGRGLYISGDFLYSAMGMFCITDVSDPSNPREISRIRTLHAPQEVVVNGDYAYLTDTDAGLEIYDVSDPIHPKIISHCLTDGQAFYIALQNDLAYVSNQDGLCIVDIQDPLNPHKIGYFQADDYLWYGGPIVVSEHYVYLANRNTNYVSPKGGFCVVDVSDPSNPVQAGIFEANSLETYSICMNGDFIFTGNGSSGFSVFYLPVATHPIRVMLYDAPGYAQGIFLKNDYLYLAANGLWIFDVSTPENPTVISNSYKGNDFNDVTVIGNLAYLLSPDLGLRIFDVSNPVNPIMIGGSEKTFAATGIVVRDQLAYIGTYDDSLRIYDVSDPADPVEIGVAGPPMPIHGIDVQGDYAYCATCGRDLTIFDVSDPTSPERISGFNGDGFHSVSVRVQGQYAYIAAENLLIVDISNPMSPSQVGVLRGSSMNLTLADRWVYLCGSKEFTVVDVENPMQPVRIGYHRLGDYGEDICVSYPYVFVAGNRDGLYVFEIEDQTIVNDDESLPADFSLVQNYPNPFNSATTIEFSVKGKGPVELAVYDITGRHVRTLLCGSVEEGIHKVEFDAGDLASGIYFYQIRFDNHVQRKKMILIK